MIRRTPHENLPEADELLLDALVQTSYTIVDALTRVAARHELSLTLLRVIAILRDRTPSMSELATHLGLDRSSVTGLIDRAVARGYMRKISDERDRRSSRVTLTPLGQDLAEDCTTEVIHEMEPLIGHLNGTQRDQLARLLRMLGVAE